MKNKLISALIAIVAFSVGYFTNQRVNNTEFLEDANSFKRELLNNQQQALEKAVILMNKHLLFDKDGSDDMADFLEYNEKVNQLLESQI